MALPVTIPYTFGTATTSIPLSQLDTDFSTIATALNGVSDGTSPLSNVSIVGGNISGLANPIAISSGGTGLNSLTSNSLLVGNGNAAVQFIAPGTAGNIVYSNGTSWISQAASVINSGRLLRAPQILTSGTSYTTPASCSSIYVEAVGGGGGGGGSSGSNSSSGGGGGGYSSKYFSVSASTSYTYAIGAAGTAGASGSAGGTGGTTTFTVSATTISAAGGTGGQANSGGSPGSGGVGSGGDFNFSGSAGQQQAQYSTSYFAGSGGGSYFGGGGRSASGTGGNYGGGGGGGNPSAAGGAGAAGVIRVWEYA